jgi:hypothetical protein
MQDEIELAVCCRLQMQNAIDVDDGRSMNTNEAARIELPDEFAERGAMDHTFATNV